MSATICRKDVLVLGLLCMLIDWGQVGAAPAPRAAAVSPPDPRATQPALAFAIAEAGLYQIALADVAALAPTFTADPERVGLLHNGREVSLEPLFSAEQVIGWRFYAPPPTNRAQASDPYRLVQRSGNGLRMATRDLSAPCADPQSTARQHGRWGPTGFYDSRRGGIDGDRFFAADLRRIAAATPSQLHVQLRPRLPLAAGEAELTLELAALNAATRTIIASGTDWRSEVTAAGDGNHALPFAVATAPLSFTLQLSADRFSERLLIDGVRYNLPAQLDFAEAGAAFHGHPFAACYRWQRPPLVPLLYDISQPEAPQRISARADGFAETLANRAYLLADQMAVPKVSLSLRPIRPLALDPATDLLYIAPERFADLLTPLLDHRRAQGFVVSFVATEALYEAWSFGFAEASAIHQFLRYSAAHWTPNLRLVTLVGDGNSDPRDRLGFGRASLLPPYLVEADPQLGEIACDSCYGRLDSADPLADLLPQLAVGRLPIKTEAELQALVAKLIAYDQQPPDPTWMGRSIYLADNPDAAGAFDQLAEMSIANQPPARPTTRVYFDPAAPVGDPIRSADPREAFVRTFAALNAGAGLVTYLGHGLQYQWAFTAPGETPYLLGLYDVDRFENGLRLPVLLSLTCLTGAFQQPSFVGTTIDERLVLAPNGGVIAAFSPTGQSVATGHQSFEHGITQVLWASERPPLLGEMLLGGYAQVLRNGRAPDLLYSFGLLGDVATRPQITGQPQRLVLPLIR